MSTRLRHHRPFRVSIRILLRSVFATVISTIFLLTISILTPKRRASDSHHDRKPDHFSIHAPRRTSVFKLGGMRFILISTHAPRAGGVAAYTRQNDGSNIFNPLLPRGRSLKHPKPLRGKAHFNPLLPCRRSLTLAERSSTSRHFNPLLQRGRSHGAVSGFSA